MVRMRHVGIKQEITVPEISVRVYERSGWTRVPPRKTKEKADGRNEAQFQH